MIQRAHALCLVIPAKAGIQFLFCEQKLDSGLRRNDETLEKNKP